MRPSSGNFASEEVTARKSVQSRQRTPNEALGMHMAGRGAVPGSVFHWAQAMVSEEMRFRKARSPTEPGEAKESIWPERALRSRAGR